MRCKQGPIHLEGPLIRNNSKREENAINPEP